MSGTVNISRRLFDSEAFQNEPLTEESKGVVRAQRKISVVGHFEFN